MLIFSAKNYLVPGAVRLILVICALATCLPSFSQVLQTDSVNLVTTFGTRITKTAARTDGQDRLVIGWKAETCDSIKLYLRFFSIKGTPATDPIFVTRSTASRSLDFDISMDTGGRTVLTWSQFDAASNKYTVMYRIYDGTGAALTAPQTAAAARTPVVKVSSNAEHGFLIAWQEVSEITYLQLYDLQGAPEGSVIQFGYVMDLAANAAVIEYTPQKTINITDLQLESQGEITAWVTTLAANGQLLTNSPSTWLRSNMNVADSDYGPGRTVITFSNGSVTYIAMTSEKLGQTENYWAMENVASVSTQVAQNENGSVAAAWYTGSELKTQIFRMSGDSIGAPAIIKTRGAMVSSFDVIGTKSSESVVVVAANTATNGSIILYRYRYLHPDPVETFAEVVDPIPQYLASMSKALSSENTHVAVWVHEDATQSAIFAQIYDSNFSAIGNPINVTGFRAYTSQGLNVHLFDVDAAMDSLGNFMILWRTLTDPQTISAKRFNPDGTIMQEEFIVNTGGNADITPRIGASNKGKFVVVWGSNYELKARRFEGSSDTGEVVIGLSPGPAIMNLESDLSKSVVSVNNSGNFIYTYRSGYYSIQFMIYNDQMAEIGLPIVRDIVDTGSGYDVALTNQNNIWLTWNVDGYFPGLRLQRFDIHGVKVGTERLIEINAEELRRPALAVNYRGEFVITYKLYGDYGPYFLQRFSKDGELNGLRQRILPFSTFATVRAGLNSRGDVFLAWTGEAFSTKVGAPPIGVTTKGVFKLPQPITINQTTATLAAGGNYDFGGESLTQSGRYSRVTGANSIETVSLQSSINVEPAPQWISAVPGDKYVNLTWIASSNSSVVKYRVYRSNTNSFFCAKLVASPATPSYLDVDVNYRAQYFYWIVSEGSNGELGEISVPQQAGPTRNPIAAPTGLTIAVQNQMNVLTWDANADPTLHYWIYINYTPTTNGAGVIASTAATTFSTSVVSGSTMYFWVAAVDAYDFVSDFSNGVSITNKIAQTISFPAISSKNRTEGSFTLISTASSGLPITFTSSNLNVATIAGNIVTLVGTGTTTITASQVGNSTYEAAPSTTQLLTVTKQAQAILFPAISQKSMGEGSFGLTASTSSGLPVTFTSSNLNIASIAGNVVTLVGEGTTIITASQIGNADFEPAASVTRTLTVVPKLAQTITFIQPAITLKIGATIKLTATSTSGLPVSFTVSDASVISVLGDVAKALKAGTATITAIQDGNSVYAAAEPVNHNITVAADPLVTGIEGNYEQSLSIYPNPTAKWLNLRGVDSDQPAIVKIIHGLGTVVDSETFGESSEIRLDVEGLPSGLYFIQVEQGGYKMQARFIKL